MKAHHYVVSVRLMIEAGGRGEGRFELWVMKDDGGAGWT